MQVDAISFSAHADFPQTSEFLDTLQPPHVVLVHGEATGGWGGGAGGYWGDTQRACSCASCRAGADLLRPPLPPLHAEMGRLKKALEQHAGALNIPRSVYMPKVTQPVLIHHKAERTAKLVGRLAEKAPAPGQPVRGLLVQRSGGAAGVLLHHEDLPRFTKLHPGRVLQRQAIALHKPFAEVREGVGGKGGGLVPRHPVSLCQPLPPAVPLRGTRCPPCLRCPPPAGAAGSGGDV